MWSIFLARSLSLSTCLPRGLSVSLSIPLSLCLSLQKPDQEYLPVGIEGRPPSPLTVLDSLRSTLHNLACFLKLCVLNRVKRKPCDANHPEGSGGAQNASCINPLLRTGNAARSHPSSSFCFYILFSYFLNKATLSLAIAEICSTIDPFPQGVAISSPDRVRRPSSLSLSPSLPLPLSSPNSHPLRTSRLLLAVP